MVNAFVDPMHILLMAKSNNGMELVSKRWPSCKEHEKLVDPARENARVRIQWQIRGCKTEDQNLRMMGRGGANDTSMLSRV